MKNLNILISGAGGDIGQSVGKILREEGCNTFGVDIDIKSPSQFIYSHFLRSVRCDDVNFESFILNFLQEYDIDVYIPIAEPELRFFMKNPHIVKSISEVAKVVIPNIEAMRVGFDKFKTYSFLKSSQLPYPQTMKASDCEYLPKPSYPFILKSRYGAGGKGLYKIENLIDWDYLSKKLDLEEFIAQAYIGSEEAEYTCGVFRSKAGKTRTITFKRILKGGYSNYGVIAKKEEIDNLLIAVAEALSLIGSINVQLRMHGQKPLIFEINPRFSSTVYFRKLFGFNDLVWAIQDVLDSSISKYEPRKDVKYFFKGYQEYVQ